jgi:hypothetical protein
MSDNIVSSEALRKCCKSIIHPSHWIPEYRLEECDPVLKEMAKKKRRELQILRNQMNQSLEQEYQEYVLELRRSK